MTLFPLPELPPAPDEHVSSDRRRTMKAARRIEAGVHPFGRTLREPRGQTCGTCAHRVQRGHGSRSYWKCPLVGGDTNGPGSDLRLKWPACDLWWGGSAPLDSGVHDAVHSD